MDRHDVLTPPAPSRPGALAAYRRLPAVAGWSYLVVSALARLPVSMVPIAVLTAVTATSGSIAAGGAAAAATAVGEALGAAGAGVLCDRHGQRRVLLLLVAAHLIALTGFVLALGGAAVPALLAAAFLAGATLPQVSPLSRVRWMRLSPADLRTAMAYEGVVDELSFVAGPASVGLIALAAGTSAPLLVAAGVTAVFATAFAAHRTHRVTGPRPAAPATAAVPAQRTRGRAPSVMRPVLGMLAMGAVFGGTQAALTASATDAGRPSDGSLVYAALAIGSTITALGMVLVPAHVSLRRRWFLSAVGLLAGALAMLAAAGTTLALVPATFLTGLFVGPVMVTVNTVTAETGGHRTGGAAMTLLTSGTVLGTALGSALAGGLADAAGTRWAFAVAAGAAAALIALAAGRLAAPAGHTGAR
ncbi:MFS transporter [Paenibacillus sp. TRM 82003]|uniref:MFS transporter n=1 Tax=Kineococcus sp. TRM81007 TaxID=2925831 RepID=UPI001F566643|nr:MFS transporter [Kineococcus sp. TRM81007]MCI2237569.1 MFS transporter [Kineococcus sp. TRM81007]MCI3921859.1 MFS transporter [Paenibacillus sp. TRM 82003]